MAIEKGMAVRVLDSLPRYAGQRGWVLHTDRPDGFIEVKLASGERLNAPAGFFMRVTSLSCPYCGGSGRV